MPNRIAGWLVHVGRASSYKHRHSWLSENQLIDIAWSEEPQTIIAAKYCIGIERVKQIKKLYGPKFTFNPSGRTFKFT